MDAIQFLPGLIILASMSLVSGVIDIREHRIPNKVLLVALVCGLIWLGLIGPNLLVSHGLSGIGVGLVLMLPLHLLGPLGAGDVKLAAVSGFFLGPALAAVAVAVALLLGGMAALIVYFYASKSYQAGLEGASFSEPRPGSMLLPFGFAVGSGFSAVGLYQYVILLGVA